MKRDPFAHCQLEHLSFMVEPTIARGDTGKDLQIRADLERRLKHALLDGQGGLRGVRAGIPIWHIDLKGQGDGVVLGGGQPSAPGSPGRNAECAQRACENISPASHLGLTDRNAEPKTKAYCGISPRTQVRFM
jgi:hypothetical protein